jgi:hypothetical protein
MPVAGTLARAHVCTQCLDAAELADAHEIEPDEREM